MPTSIEPQIFEYEEKTVGDRQKSIPLRTYSCILVIGVGGIGSWVVLDLALTGMVNNLILYDPDKVDPTNLNRTPFRISDIGRYKVDALYNLIVERRLQQNVEIHRDLFKKNEIDPATMHPKDTCIIDCRDDIFKDLRRYECKVWKLGYDGLSITIDGNPRNTRVWGRSNGYQTVPSFVCSAQLAANLLVNHILMRYNPFYIDHPKMDEHGTFNSAVTFNSAKLIYDIYNLEHPESVNGRSRKGVLRNAR